ncbi:rRNA-processing endoribonuclease [Halocaridina rubra]|uniref:rRNA-processing endoribonuclease n=1 Tax=Halocaridina rubra TaxID=373956 RepID=A0AAN9FUY8_HALRR
MASEGELIYEGSNFFRQRLTLATLCGKPIKIKNIRTSDAEPGLKEYEASFIRLLDKLCNGSQIVVNDTGTSVLYKPGILMGGQLDHSCSNQRAIGYYLEPLFMLSPFCKNPVIITLTGVTNNKVDPSIDMIRTSMLPVMKKFFGTDDELSLKLVKRGLQPGGGGTVTFTCPIRRTFRSFQWLESGRVKRIRGVAYSSRVAPAVTNRMLDAAKKVFATFLTDVYFTVDNAKGKSPGFGLCTVAETNKGSYLSAESISNPPSDDVDIRLPEDIGQEAAWRLLEEIYRGGCVDSLCQPLVLLFMILTSKDISKIVLGPLTPYSIHFLRHIRDFFQVTFKIDEYQDNADLFSDGDKEAEEKEFRCGEKKLVLTCVGIGYTNVSKGQI